MHTREHMDSIDVISDGGLVAACQGGDRNAFAPIVERYQRLLCSLAYSSTGSVSESEDVAQETFVTAWRQLADLREPEKLRPWLCGILRHKLSRLRRADGREPVRQAADLDSAGELASNEESTMEVVSKKEEQEILRTELGRVPEPYREVLVLYYREHRSVEHVASALELTEDAVKQRLTRGRRILQERVLAFVEGALARSTPGRVFTLGVLAALPEIAAPAKAAVGIGAAVTHGATMAKTTGIAALLASVTGVVNFVLSLRAALDQARTRRERRTVVKAVLFSFLSSLGFLAVIYLLREAAFRWWDLRGVFAIASQVLVLAFVAVWPFAMARMMQNFRRLRSEERLRHPESFRHAVDQIGSSAGEYKSRASLFGVPLVHIRFAMAEEGSRPLFAWIAAGDRAYGLLFAWGTFAVAPVSAGVVSAGILTVGCVSLGVIGLGTVATGLIALGCVSIGVKAYAWISALGWETATGGGFGIARIAAEAPIAFAQHANDPAARAILADPNAERNQMLFFIAITLLTMIPLVAYVRAVRERIGRKARQVR